LAFGLKLQQSVAYPGVAIVHESFRDEGHCPMPKNPDTCEKASEFCLLIEDDEFLFNKYWLL
jgi:hypothetical protein